MRFSLSLSIARERRLERHTSRMAYMSTSYAQTDGRPTFGRAAILQDRTRGRRKSRLCSRSWLACACLALKSERTYLFALGGRACASQAPGETTID